MMSKSLSIRSSWLLILSSWLLILSSWLLILSSWLLIIPSLVSYLVEAVDLGAQHVRGVAVVRAVVLVDGRMADNSSIDVVGSFTVLHLEEVFQYCNIGRIGRSLSI